jgi:hypothetical protein
MRNRPWCRCRRPRWWGCWRGRRGVTHRWGHARGRRRGSRGGKSEHQPRPVLWVAEGDRPPVMNEDRRHAHAVDVDAGFTAIDGDPLVAVEVQDYQRRRAGSVHTVEPDVCARADADRDVSAGGERVATRAEPDDQGDAEPCRRHTHPLFSPNARVETPLSSRRRGPRSTVGRRRWPDTAGAGCY